MVWVLRRAALEVSAFWVRSEGLFVTGSAGFRHKINTICAYVLVIALIS